MNDSVYSTLVVSEHFSRTPGPRMKAEGKFSGEEFRLEHLLPKLQSAIENKAKLEIVLDGTAGYGTSFLEEAFGGLVRHNNLSCDVIKKHISIVSKEQPYLIEDVYEYLVDAQKSEK